MNLTNVREKLNERKAAKRPSSGSTFSIPIVEKDPLFEMISQQMSRSSEPEFPEFPIEGNFQVLRPWIQSSQRA